jgi:hypothetical protein
MIKDIKMWEEFEKKLIRESVSDYQKNSKIFEMMLNYAKSIGAFPPLDPLEGIEVDIRIAKILNSRE